MIEVSIDLTHGQYEHDPAEAAMVGSANPPAPRVFSIFGADWVPLLKLRSPLSGQEDTPIGIVFLRRILMRNSTFTH